MTWWYLRRARFRRYHSLGGNRWDWFVADSEPLYCDGNVIRRFFSWRSVWATCESFAYDDAQRASGRYYR